MLKILENGMRNLTKEGSGSRKTLHLLKEREPDRHEDLPHKSQERGKCFAVEGRELSERRIPPWKRSVTDKGGRMVSELRYSCEGLGGKKKKMFSVFLHSRSASREMRSLIEGAKGAKVVLLKTNEGARTYALQPDNRVVDTG